MKYAGQPLVELLAGLSVHLEWPAVSMGWQLGGEVGLLKRVLHVCSAGYTLCEQRPPSLCHCLSQGEWSSCCLGAVAPVNEPQLAFMDCGGLSQTQMIQLSFRELTCS